MKKYVKPMMESELFATNEYVAACYKIKCTTPNNNGTYYYIYDDTNRNGVLDSGDNQVFSSLGRGFKGCNQWHKGVIQDEAPVANGFVTDRNGRNVQEVFYWVEDLGSTYDYHVMTPGKENYETNPNAS